MKVFNGPQNIGILYMIKEALKLMEEKMNH